MTHKATDLITVTVLGKTFKACRHCAAHMERTAERFAKRFPKARLYITQGPHNTGVPASAGTHDYCSAFDWTVSGLDYWTAQRWFREQGWAVWYRKQTPGLWIAHLHGLSIGCKARVGIYVPGQIADYYAHKTGMKGHADDPSWFPPDINATRFTYTPEDDMAQYADTLAAIQKDVAAIRTDLKHSRRQQRTTNALLRRVRDLVKGDSALLAEIDAALAAEEA